MATWRELIRTSLRLLNVIAVNEDVDDDQIESDMLAALNRMLESWSMDKLITTDHATTDVSLIQGTASYAIAAKPYNVVAAYVRDGDYDYPVEIISQKEYSEIVDKSTESQPTQLYYDPGVTSATVYLYPVPEKSYTLKLAHYDEISTVSSVTDTISLPLGYEKAILYNLTVMASPEFLEGSELNQFVVREAEKSLEKIKLYNIGIPPKKKYDRALSRNHYDIYRGDYA